MTEIKEIMKAAIAACDPPSRYRLAKELHLSHASISKWWTGKTHPSGKNLLRMMSLANRKQPTPAQQQQARARLKHCILC